MDGLFDFKNKTVVITGGTRGIGAAAARLFGSCGARLVISGRKEEACQVAQAQLHAEGFEAVAVSAHAGRKEDCYRLIDEAVKAFGSIDVLVGNAGVNPVFDPLIEVADEAWDKILDTNVSGPRHLAAAAFPHLKVRGGAVVFTSSINSQLGVPKSGAYGISKAALEQMTRQLAVEWGQYGIRVNAVSPGTTQTDMIRSLMERSGFTQSVVARTPLARLGEPEDVGAVIAFLASAAARHVTGQVITVDGGETIARGLG